MTETKRESKKEKAHKLLRNNEPQISQFTYDHDIMMAMQHYNLNHDNKEKRKWVLSAYPKLKFNSELSDFYYRTAGTLIRIRDNGNDLSAEHLNLIEKEIKFLSTPPEPKVVQQVVLSQKPTIQESMDEKVSSFLGEFAGLVDEYTTNGTIPKVDKLINSMNIRGPMTKKVADRVQNIMAELREAIEGKDKQLVEGYSQFKKAELKKLLGIYETLIENLNQAKVVTPRKPRAIKVKPPAVIAKGVKYLAENVDLGIKSINPAHVVGQTEVWLFNPKYRKMFVYKAIEGMTLTFKGSALLNWDTSKSECKSIRKVEGIIPLLGQGKRTWAKFMNDQKTKPGVCNGRINSETLIMVSFK